MRLILRQNPADRTEMKTLPEKSFNDIVPSELLRLIRRNKKFLVLSHVNPEGDSAGSCIALALGLKKIGKTVYILNRDSVPEILRFLPFSNLFSRDHKIRTQQFDVLFLVDCNTIERTGFKDIKTKNIIIIDHHILHQPNTAENINSSQFPVPSSQLFSWIVPEAAAAGELVYKLLDALHVPLDKAIATNLYTAIFTDTGSFRYSNTTPETLNIASRLIEAGVDTWEITKEVYENISFNRLRLLTLCLATLEKQGRAAWITITQDMFKKTNTSVQDTENFVDYARKIKGVEAGILFRQEKKDLYKISFRSKGAVNVADIATAFGGGGHSNAAGCTVKGSLNDVKEKVLKAVRASIKKSKRKI
ncbi:MAG: bifunctional oligoribonuclease/PAP phosphatase NrnA [Nitrospirae bacterium]|nr:bifunctional oligoribonuclease/PAP phosphatase NrnA [Nitrospirota bacterium]